jgi:hypothetical protein
MRAMFCKNSKIAHVLFWVGGLAVLFVIAAIYVGCSSSNTSMPPSGTGTVHVSITDPPSCAFPNGNFDHVYITIRSVQAHTSTTADGNTPGWQELAPQLNTQPMQIDLFAAGTNACLLTMLGSNTALPAGTYQQIRLLLVPNDGGGGPVPSTNACGNQGYNCVQLHSDGSFHELQLSSQANTGLKIPPGQVQGGPIMVSPGQDVDLNIDFNACASIIQQGNGRFRLKPVLTAAQVSTNTTGISGQVVDSATQLPIAGGTVLVALEQPDSMGTDIISRQTVADSNGNFNFCPLPTAATFDVVVVAINDAGVAYNATVAAGVPGGTNLGAIPLVAETGGTSTGPATLQGYVTATTGTDPAEIVAAVSAMQTITLNGGGTRAVTIPAEDDSTSNISVDSNTDCPSTAPLNTNCAQYTLIEPASNPSVGFFSGGSISYAPPASGDVPYSVGASAFATSDGSTPDCTPPSLTASEDSDGNPLIVTPGATVTPAELDFSGCSAPTP